MTKLSFEEDADENLIPETGLSREYERDAFGRITSASIGERVATGGLLVTRASMQDLFGFTKKVFDGLLKEGAPAELGTHRHQGHRYNTKNFLQWLRLRDVRVVTGETGDLEDGFDSAKRREKDANATLKEFQILERQGLLVPLQKIVEKIGPKLDVFRQGIYAMPHRVSQDIVAIASQSNKTPATMAREVQDLLTAELDALFSELDALKTEDFSDGKVSFEEDVEFYDEDDSESD